MPGARGTRGLVCKVHIESGTRAYRFSGGNPAFPAQWFYGLLRALPGDRALLPPSPADIATRQLDASVGASGPHGFAVRNKRFRPTRISARLTPLRPPHPTPTSVTIMIRPSCGVGRCDSISDLG